MTSLDKHGLIHLLLALICCVLGVALVGLDALASFLTVAATFESLMSISL
ncbi:hypothetical protein [Exilibacterium tricleocarpae]|nr:hypothetical protein [Exilibacterium tricleocarpae]